EATVSDSNRIIDVFVSHPPSEAKLASDLANACRAYGLEAATSAEFLLVEDAEDALWDALAESRALLIILSPAGLTSTMGIELGAARAWTHAVFGIVADPSVTSLPVGLSGIQLYPSSRIEDVLRLIKLGGQELSEDDRSLLARLYSKIGVS